MTEREVKMEKQYIAIDLKSFFASVECVERQLDPLRTNLVVADATRTEKTICLAVSPSLKQYGIPGRARLFEVVQRVKEVNKMRQQRAGHPLTEESCFDEELKSDPDKKVSYLVAPPRMSYYMKYSTKIYNIYLRYVAPEDIHVYSIDEVFMDVTSYLRTYGMNAHDLAMQMIRDVLQETGITATAGIGTNLYLCKIAMDIVAKKMPADASGVRIAQIDEPSYRRLLWDHRPLTDFWRVGRGYARKLEKCGIYTMGDIARCSLGKPEEYYNEELLYRLFGINAELLIDHAWGWEPCTIADIKAYKPEAKSISSGQVLKCPYPCSKARLIVQEMTDLLVLELVEKGYVTDQLVLTVGYDIDNLTDPVILKKYHGEITTDRYGRRVPKHAHGTENLDEATSSTKRIMEGMLSLYDRIINPDLLIRRITVVAAHLQREQDVMQEETYEQMDLFTDYEQKNKEKQEKEEERRKEKQIQKAILNVQKKYGKNALIKGMSLQEGATTMERNRQIGGHKA